jgi:hypothetical protein
MHLHDCAPSITPQGNLKFSIPGFGSTAGTITPWSGGFQTRQVRNRKAMPGPPWSLNMLSRTATRPMPAEIDDFINEIPECYRERTRQFEFGQCLVLQLLARLPQARDLCLSNPVLLWLLTTAVYDSIIQTPDIPALLGCKQAEILARITRRASGPALRLLRKTVIGDGSLSEFRILVHALGDRHMQRTTAHIPSVSIALLGALSSFPILSKPGIARLLAQEIPDDRNARQTTLNELAETVRDIQRMGEALSVERPAQALARCRTLDDIRRLHDRWVDRVNRRGDLWVNPVQRANRLGDLNPDETKSALLQLKFPAAPIRGNRDVRPITTPDALVYEGKLQGNCIADYAAAIAAGKTYAYKVLHPHRATLEVILTEEGWKLGELKLSCNRMPGEAVKRRVEEWLAQNS